MTSAAALFSEALVPSWSCGDISVWSLLDGTVRVPPDALEFASAAVGRSLHLRPQGEFDIPVNVFLLVCGGKKALVDAGGGSWACPGLGGARKELERLGCSCADIDLILMTHLHPDHVTGLVDDVGDPVYPAAEIVVHEREIDFWFRSPRSAMTERTRRNATFADRACAPYLDRIRQIREGDESMPGLVSVELPGHTPGHTGWRLTAPQEYLYFWGDIVHVGGTQLLLPNTAIMFDVDKNAFRKTRNRLLPELARAPAVVAGAHLPQGGIGTLARNRDGFAFTPLEKGRPAHDP